MTAIKAKTVAVECASDSAPGGTGPRRGASGVLPASRRAAACGSPNRTSARAGDISDGGGPARNPSRHRRSRQALASQSRETRRAAAGRHFAARAGHTSRAIVQPAGPTPRFRRRG